MSALGLGLGHQVQSVTGIESAVILLSPTSSPPLVPYSAHTPALNPVCKAKEADLHSASLRAKMAQNGTAGPIKVGFIGLGIMGTAMARNLLKSGLFAEVMVHNRTLSKVRASPV